jgi:hypothetical protein
MPNWCSHSLTISGPRSEMKAFYAENNLIPSFKSWSSAYLESQMLLKESRFQVSILLRPVFLENLLQLVLEYLDADSYFAFRSVSFGVRSWAKTPKHVISQVDRRISNKNTLRIQPEEADADYKPFESLLSSERCSLYFFDLEICINEVDKFRMTFNTKWQPHEEIYRQLKSKYPTLLITLGFVERGVEFFGEFLSSGIEYVDNDNFRANVDYDEEEGTLTAKGVLKELMERHGLIDFGG